MSFNNISWSTGPNTKWFLRVVPHDAHYQKCTNGSALLMKGVTRDLDKNVIKQHFLLNHCSKFNIVLPKCSAWCLLPKLIRMFSSAEQHHGTRATNRNIFVYPRKLCLWRLYCFHVFRPCVRPSVTFCFLISWRVIAGISSKFANIFIYTRQIL